MNLHPAGKPPFRRIPPRALAELLLASSLMVLVGTGCESDSEVKPRKAPEDATLVATDSLGDLARVSRADGQAQPYLDTFVAPAVDLGSDTAIAYDAVTETLYATTGPTTPCPGCLYTIDRVTGEALLLADNSTLGTGAAGMAAAPDGTLYGYFMPGDTLATLDTTTGAATAIGAVTPPGTGGNGIGFDLAGTLYHGDNANLNVLDPLTGAVLSSTPYAFVGFPALNGVTRLISLATHPLEDRLYGILDDAPAGGAPRYLVTVDPDGTLVNCGETSPEASGLTFLPPEPRYVLVPPEPPRDVQAFGHNGAVRVSWEMTCVPTAFNLYYGTSPDVTPWTGTAVRGLRHPPFDHAPLSNGVPYYYVMTAVNGAGESDPTAVIAGTPTSQITLISFAPYAGPFANTVSLLDDQVRGPYPIGFTFTFFGRDYTQFYVSSNGFLTFWGGSPSGCCAGRSIPKADGLEDLIALAWTDLNPGAGGTVTYQTQGVAPDRQLVLEFANVPTKSGGTVQVQAILFEGSNVIELHTDHIDGGQVTTQGVENALGTEARADPEHVARDFSLSLSAIRFRTNP